MCHCESCDSYKSQGVMSWQFMTWVMLNPLVSMLPWAEPPGTAFIGQHAAMLVKISAPYWQGRLRHGASPCPFNRLLSPLAAAAAFLFLFLFLLHLVMACAYAYSAICCRRCYLARQSEQCSGKEGRKRITVQFCSPPSPSPPPPSPLVPFCPSRVAHDSA